MDKKNREQLMIAARTKINPRQGHRRASPYLVSKNISRNEVKRERTPARRKLEDCNILSLAQLTACTKILRNLDRLRGDSEGQNTTYTLLYLRRSKKRVALRPQIGSLISCPGELKKRMCSVMRWTTTGGEEKVFCSECTCGCR